MKKGLESRLIIHEILKSARNYPLNLDLVFIKTINKKQISLSDRNMIKNVVLNSMRHYLIVEEIIKKYTKKIKKFNDSYYLLLSAITQLIILNFKDFAVIDSSVELTKNKNINASGAFINGILRNINRNKKKIYITHYKFSKLPSWFTKKISYWNNKQKNYFIKNILKEPNLHLVFKNDFDLKKINIDKMQTTKQSIFLKTSMSIKKIPGYKEGYWWIQDFSSMMPLYLTNDIKNKITADLCAAPGGKTFQLINYGAHVKAFEKNIERAKIMNENLKRLKFHCKLKIMDVLNISEHEKFDLIILDAPCSSVGTIRRHPEIFFRKQIPNFNKLYILQKQLLNKAKMLLKKNGILIYMVCSFLIEEGEEQIFNFLKKNKNFSILNFSPLNLKESKIFINKHGFFYTPPSQINNGLLIDGFFAAKLIKND